MEKVQTELDRLAVDIAMQAYFPGASGIIGRFSDWLFKSFRRSLPEKINLFAVTHGNAALNQKIGDSGKTLLDIALNPGFVDALVPEGKFKDTGRRMAGTQAAIDVIRAHGGKTAAELDNTRKAVEMPDMPVRDVNWQQLMRIREQTHGVWSGCRA